MEYKRIKWIDDDTELSAENFNHMEEGIENSQNVELIAVTDTAPSTCTIGDKYYNTTDNLIYTATGTNTWDTAGQAPIEGIFYIVFSEQSSYSYNGTTLISVGGGTEDIVISPEEPTTEDWKIWINPDDPINNIGSEVVDTLDGNETNKAPSVRTVKEELDNKINEIPKIKWKQYTTPSSDSEVITGYDGTSNIIGFQVYAFEQWRSGTEVGTLAKTNDKLFYLNKNPQASNYFNKPIRIFYI